jgi:4-carboxymuconolactone decarboxylase
MARLPYLEAEESAEPELVAALYHRIAGWGRPVGHLYKVLANQPSALEAFLGMSHYIRDRSSLDDPLREIAVLSTAQALAQPYERAHHEPVALSAGVEPSTIEAIAAGHTDRLEPLARAVAAYADQVARRHDVDEKVFEELRRGLSDAELTDLVVTVAWYHLCAAILGPLRVEVEQEYASR